MAVRIHTYETAERVVIFPRVLGSLTDAKLVARCRTRDDAAWSELVNRFARYGYAIIGQGLSRRAADAEDVFQEVFTRTYQHLDRLRNDEAIRPWIAQLTRRLCIDRIRAGSREQLSDEELEPREMDETLATLDESLDVHEALAELPENCQEILDRFFSRDESYQTIAAGLDIPAGTIASRISRCLTTLRVLLAGRETVPDTS